MYLSNINFFNFRNLISKKIYFDKKMNIFYGNNGQGKTSVLEAIYFSITGKSFRNSNIKTLLKYNSDDMAVYSEYNENNIDKSIAVNYKDKKKEYYYNKKKVKFDEYFGKITVISFIPEDINMIMSSPGVRRSFFNYEISQANVFYYNKLKDFENVIKTRNKLIKEHKTKSDIFAVYNEKYIKLSIEIMKERREYIKKLSILLNLNYRRLFNSNTELKLKYISSIGDISKLSDIELEKKFEIELEKVKKREIKYGFSALGPQKDDFIFLLSGKESKHFSSEGEKRSVIFSLKIAEIDMIVKGKKNFPIFLIDDISSYFDKERQNKVLNYFNKREIQVFITSTEKLEIESRFFYIKEGVVNEKSELNV